MAKFDWLNEYSEQFLERGYLRPNQTGQERVKEIADHFGKLRGEEKGDKFYKYASEGYYSFSSPVWSNYGEHSKGYSVSCFGSVMEDSIPSILETVAEVGSMSQKGGGCSGYLGNIRPRGSKVNNGRGSTSGSVHFLELFESLTDVISQSGVRRGFFTPYLDAEHGDIEEFLTIGEEGSPIQTLTTGVNFSDEFMNRVVNKDRDALGIWAKWIMQRKELGTPYGNFISTVNRNTVDVYKDKEMKIVASNMCVAPSTRILTDKGEKVISELEGVEVNVWNGEEWSPVTVAKTSPSERIYKVILKDQHGDESVLYCTQYHRWFLQDESEVITEDLKNGDCLLEWATPESAGGNVRKHVVFDVIDTSEDMPVYCFTEHKRGMGVFNGILTGQCNEIALPSSPEESFVCVLSAMNIMKWEEWKDTDAVEILTEFLDTVVDDFISKLEAERDSGTDGAKTFDMMKRAYRFAIRHRALGIGSLGLADYLMSKSIPFNSTESEDIDEAVHKHIQERSWAASKDMAERLGEPEVLKGYGRRNTTLTAMMPTKSSSFILGQVSQTCEPRMSNYYTEDLAKTKYMYKNPYLREILKGRGADTLQVWRSIADSDGSVQHLVGDVLTEDEGEVFLTFGEIDPYVIINRAAKRQEYVDQGQSINLMIGPQYTPKEISQLYIHAWKVGVKGVYYSYNTNSSQELSRKEACASCSV